MTELELTLLERLAAAERRIGALEAELASTERRRARDRQRKADAAEAAALALAAADEDAGTPPPSTEPGGNPHLSMEPGGNPPTSADFRGNPRNTVDMGLVLPPGVSLDPPAPPINPSLPPFPASSASSAGQAEADGGTATATAEPVPPELVARVVAGLSPAGARQLEGVVDALPEGYRAPLLGFLVELEAARRMAWSHSLAMLLRHEGTRLRPTPDQVGRALLEISQNGGDNATLFRRYVGRVIAEDAELVDSATAAAAATAPDPERRAAATRAAPQNYRAARGRALLEATEVIAWIRGHRHAEYRRSLALEARGQLTGRRLRAVEAVGGIERILGDEGADEWLRDKLADAFQALPASSDGPRSDPPSTPAGSA